MSNLKRVYAEVLIARALDEVTNDGWYLASEVLGV